MWAGNEVFRQEEYLDSFMQRTAPRLRRSEIIESNKIVKKLKYLRRIIKPSNVIECILNMGVLTFSDA